MVMLIRCHLKIGGKFFAWNEQVIKVVDRIIYKFKFGNLLQSNNDVYEVITHF